MRSIQHRSMSSVYYDDTEHQKTNFRINTVVCNVLGGEHTELKQALNQEKSNEDIKEIINKLFRKKKRITLDREKAKNLEIMQYHVHQMIQDRNTKT